MAQNVVDFEGIGRCFYTKVEFRAPKRGEFYLSGAIVAAYRAPNDYLEESKYHIVVPTHHAQQSRDYVKGEAIVVAPL